MKECRATGIVLSRINTGEADRVLRIFTREYGLITVFAKGIRREKSVRRGHAEVGCILTIRFLEKHSGMPLLTSAEALHIPFHACPESLLTLFSFLLPHLPERAPLESLYDLTAASLPTLSKAHLPPYQKAALRLLGTE